MGVKKGSRKKEGLGKLKDVTGMRIYRLRQPLFTWKRKAEMEEANPEVLCKDHTSGQPPMRWGNGTYNQEVPHLCCNSYLDPNELCISHRSLSSNGLLDKPKMCVCLWCVCVVFVVCMYLVVCVFFC